MSEYVGFLAELQWSSTGGTVYTKVGNVRDISGPSLERESIDVSHRDTPDNWRKFKKGFKNGGEVTFNVVFDPDLATHGTGAAGLWSDFDDDTTIPTWRLIFSEATGTVGFLGFVQNLEPSDPFDDAQLADLTIKVDGKPTLTH